MLVDFRKRRVLFAALFLSVACAATGVSPSQARTDSQTTKAASWFVGGRLCLAANVYYRDNGNPDEFLRSVQDVGNELGVQIAPFPPRPEKADYRGLLRMLDYLNNGGGARVGAQIDTMYGSDDFVLYNEAVHFILMPMVYDLDPADGDKFAKSIAADSLREGLPENLWKPAITAVANRAPFDVVKKASIQSYLDIQTYLANAAKSSTR